MPLLGGPVTQSTAAVSVLVLFNIGSPVSVIRIASCGSMGRSRVRGRPQQSSDQRVIRTSGDHGPQKPLAKARMLCRTATRGRAHCLNPSGRSGSWDRG